MPAPVNSVDVGGYAKKSSAFGIFMVTFAAFGGILYGYDTGVINGLLGMDNFKQTFNDLQVGDKDYPGLSSGRQSLFVSILSAGTFVGALFAAPFADFLGRKFGIVFSTMVFCLGVALQTATSGDVALFVVGRVFAGLGVGLISVTVPMYQSECAPKWIRGAVVGMYQWAITIGILLAAVINNATKDRQDHSSYRIPIGVQFIWAFILVAGVLTLPESPRWLILKGKRDRAALALARLTGMHHQDQELIADLDLIQLNLDEERRLSSGSSYIDCLKPSHNKILLRTMTGVGLQALQQLTGVNFIFYFGTSFFQSAGIPNPFIISVATSIINVFSTLPGLWGLERFGRRSMLVYGGIGMTICEFIVAITGVTTNSAAGKNVLVAFVCIYIAHFAATWGPLAWVVTSEIFPLEIRAKCMSYSTASNWLLNFAIGYATPYLVNDQPGSANLGVKVFFIWGSTCAACTLYALIVIPETKGMSLEQIDEMYISIDYPWQATRYRRELSEKGLLGATAAEQEAAKGIEPGHVKEASLGEKEELEHA